MFTALRDLYNSMDKSGAAIPPMIFIQVLHMAYPQFAEKSEHGGFAQQVRNFASVFWNWFSATVYVLIDVRYSEFDLMQDANECWTEVVRCLQQEVDVPQELSKVNWTCAWCQFKSENFKRLTTKLTVIWNQENRLFLVNILINKNQHCYWIYISILW